MKESTAWLLTSAMQDVVKIGTGTAARLTNVDMPSAGKTGSSSSYYDLWFCGFTPYYTASIWSGFDNNNITQADKTYPRKLWKKIMEEIVIQKEQERREFTMPDSIVKATICTKSGKLASEGICDHYEGGNSTKVEYFAKGTEPTEKCDVHVKAYICTESKALATDACPADKVVEKVLLIKDETGKTADTPYVLPKNYCSIHNGNATTLPPVQEPTQPVVTPPANNGDTDILDPDDSGTDNDTDDDSNPDNDLLPGFFDDIFP